MDIPNLIKTMRNGGLALPEFQRPYVWSSSKISELLDSIFEGFPIGAITTWYTNERLLGAESLVDSIKPPSEGFIRYILDGQQRLKTLYYLFGTQKYLDMSKPKAKRRKYIDFYYYLDLKFNPDKHDHRFISFSDIKKDKNRFKKNEVCLLGIDMKNRILLLHKGYDSVNNGEHPIRKQEISFDEFKIKKMKIRYINVQLLNNKKILELTRKNFFTEKDTNYIYDLFPVISTEKKTIQEIKVSEGMEIEKIAKIFGRINQSGIKLTVFDLLVALTWDKDSYNIRDCFDELLNISYFKDFFGENFDKYAIFSQIISLKKFNSLSEKNQLRLRANDFKSLEIKSNKIKNPMSKSLFRDCLSKAVKFLQKHKVPNFKKMRYQRVLHILTVLYIEIYAKNGRFKDIKNEPNFNHIFNFIIEIWYWRVLFSETFAIGSNIPPNHLKALKDILLDTDNYSKTEKDIQILIDGIIKSELISEDDDIGTLSDPKYRPYLAQLILFNKGKDFITGKVLEWNELPTMDKMEYHHIFPRSLLSSNPYNLSGADKIDYCGNITPITKDVNIAISDRSPFDYFNEFKKNYKGKKLLKSTNDYNDILESHFIPDYTKWKISNPIEFYDKFIFERIKLVRIKIKELQKDLREVTIRKTNMP